MTNPSIEAGSPDDPYVLDALDRQLLACLRFAPRAPFRTLGEALGVSEQTVARRYRRLHADGVVKVTAVGSAEAVGQTTWLVRVVCTAAGIGRIAGALARRDDVGWVFIAGGGTEVICTVRSTTAAAREDLLLAKLPSSGPVRSVTTALALHRFAGGPTAGAEKITARQRRVLQGDAPPPAGTGVVPRPSETDRALLAELQRDGRAGYAQLARAAGLTQGAATRHLHSLLRQGIAWLDVDVAPRALGRPVQAHLWMTALPARLHECGEQLARLPEVAFAAAVSGLQNLVAVVSCRSHDDLYVFVTGSVGRIEGLTGVEVVPTIAVVKQATSLVTQDVLAR